jgi:hypothetical protein
MEGLTNVKTVKNREMKKLGEFVMFDFRFLICGTIAGDEHWVQEVRPQHGRRFVFMVRFAA